MMLTKQDLRDITSIVHDAIQTSVPPIVHNIVNKAIDNLIQTEIRPFRKEMDDFAIAVANQFGRVEKRLDMLEYRMENIETRMDGMEIRMESMEGKMDDILLIQNVHESRITTLEDSSRQVRTVLKLG